jgi:hypothetical protein
VKKNSNIKPQQQSASLSGIWPSVPLQSSSGNAIELDVAKYEALLADSDLSEDQKTEILQTLWEIIVTFVDMGFGLHPVQQACGEKAEDRASPTIEPQTRLQSTDLQANGPTLSHKYQGAVKPHADTIRRPTARSGAETPDKEETSCEPTTPTN